MSQSLSPTGRIEEHGVMLMVSLSFNILVVCFLVASWNLQSCALWYILWPAFPVIVYCSFERNKMGSRLSGENKILMVCAFVVYLLPVSVNFYFQSAAKEVLIVFILIFICSFLFQIQTSYSLKKMEALNSKWIQH